MVGLRGGDAGAGLMDALLVGGSGAAPQTLMDHMALPITEALPRAPVLQSFFAGGFECSTFKRRSGQRLDFID